MRAWDRRRRQWGPTKNEEEITALGQLADEGFNPSTRREAAVGINERAKSNRAARGEMAYDQAQGRLVPSSRRPVAEQAEPVQRLGVSAEDYWERNPESKRTAVNSRGETVDVMDLNRAYVQDREADRRQADRRAEVVANYRNNRKFAEGERLASRLEAKGVDQMPTKDNRPDVDKMRGMLSASTFQQWDDDKMLDRSAKQVEKDTRRELRYWTQAQDGRFGVGAQNAAMSRENQARIAQLRADVDQGENKRQSLSGPRGWRQIAERELSNNAKNAAAATNLEKAANAQKQTYAEAAQNLGLTLEELFRKIRGGELTPEEQMAAFGQAAAGN
jgi:hypothetical protein